jgi:hypothetical protein
VTGWYKQRNEFAGHIKYREFLDQLTFTIGALNLKAGLWQPGSFLNVHACACAEQFLLFGS